MTRVFNRFPDMAYYRGNCLEAVYVTMTYKNTKLERLITLTSLMVDCLNTIG
ncbi:ORF199 [Ectromelia virus WH]|nr:ORF199 [Ectromelia virus WH]